MRPLQKGLKALKTFGFSLYGEYWGILMDFDTFPLFTIGRESAQENGRCTAIYYGPEENHGLTHWAFRDCFEMCD